MNPLPCAPTLAVCFAFMSIFGAALAQDRRTTVEDAHRATAFVHVNVVPMDRERIVGDQTVIVRDGRIAEMGAADGIEVPKDARSIDGRGQYLMPGLADMHAHLYTPQEFPLYLAHGVTTVFNLWGKPAHLMWREKIARGEWLGPTIHTCGPIIFRAETADEARRIVEAQSKAGYDSIKIYNDVSKVAYPVLIETARRNKMLVVGHIPRAVGLEGVLKARQPIAHAEEFIYTFFDWNVEDEGRIPAAVAATREANVPVTLTLVFYDHMLRQAGDLTTFLARPEMKYLAPWARVLWGPGLNRYNPANSSPASLRWAEKSLAFQKTLARSLHQAGVKILAGTDAMTPGAVPGFSLHEELGIMAGLGFTPFEAIETATRNAAEFLSPGKDFGTVAVGQRADLILLKENPLADLANLQHRAGVMVHGDWRTEVQFQEMLDDVPAAYARAEQTVQPLLAGDPARLLGYIDESDPFAYVALAAVANRIAEQGAAQFSEFFREIYARRPDAELSAEINVSALAHRMFQLKKSGEAIALLVMNAEAHPKSAPAHARLAAAYRANGDKALAVESCRKALAIDPQLAGATEMLEQLSRPDAALPK